MIRYPILDADLNARIDAIAPTWRERARNRTEALASDETQTVAEMWSEIKPVYMHLQGPKCAFCEKWIEDQAIEQDVEHFRPKNRIKRWTIPRKLQNEGIEVSQPDSGTESGYRLLAYHPLNYISACKTCNSVLKRDHFPIAGIRNNVARDPQEATAERPYLIYPLGNVDEDPESLLEFHGLSPQARRTGFDRLRVLVTVELFKLDDVRNRKELLRDRAEFIEKLVFALRIRDNPASSNSDLANAKAVVQRLTSPRSRHTNCVRCFERLWNSNRPEAESVYANIAKFLNTTSA